MSVEKNFGEWMGLKEKIHNSNRVPAIKEGEIWWCAMGENVGVEINGKNGVFSRPILIFKKLSRFSFMGIPLTSKEHSGSWYVKFQFHGKPQTAVLAQARVISVSRLYSKIGDIDDLDKAKVGRAFRMLYLSDKQADVE